MRQSVEVVISHVFPREGGPRIPRSMTGPVHTWKSRHYFHGPVYLAFMRQSMVAAGRIPDFFYVKVDSEWKGTSEYVFVFSAVLGPTAVNFPVEQFIAPWSLKRRWHL